MNKKKWVLIAGVALAAALGAGIWFASQGGGDPVNVYSFQYVGMTEFWGDTQESYGPVTTDKIQTVFLSDTQTVTEVAVKNGDTVKKGDVLFSFDTTLDALSLERKRLDVEKIKVQIKAAEERLQDTREMIPYVPPKENEPEEPDLGEELTDLFQISKNSVYDGGKPETALICWLKDTTPVSDAILQELYKASLQYRAENAGKEDPPGDGSNASGTPEEQPDAQDVQEPPAQEEEKTYQVPGFFTCNGKTVKPDNMVVGKDGYLIRNAYVDGDKTYWMQSATRKADGMLLTDLRIAPYPQTAEAQAEWEALWGAGVEVKYMRDVSVSGKQLKDSAFADLTQNQNAVLEIGQDAVFMFHAQMKNPPKDTKLTFEVTPSNGILTAAYYEDTLILTGKPENATDAPVNYKVTASYSFPANDNGQAMAVKENFSFSISVEEPSQTKKDEFYVVFKVTEKNLLKGTLLVWQGAKVTVFEDGSFDMQLYDASGFADHTLPPPEDIEIELPEINPDAIYTAEEILEMQKQLYATIKEQTEKLKMAETEFAIMERELGDGNIYAEIDGKVVSLLTEEEARLTNQSIVKVSGGGGFYIEGSVSELEKEKLRLGQEVTINDWNTGSMYTGEVVSIGDFPTKNDNWNGMGNPTASYYPFKAFVGEEAELQAGSFVSMSYSSASAEQGIYLEKPFVRTENGKSYIFVRGSDGRLEKREIQVGKVLWGSYYEILSPLGEEDFLAFPYGKQVKEGAPTVESDLSALYGF